MRALLLLCCAACVPPEGDPGPAGDLLELELESADFADDGPIPARFTCDGEDLSPSLFWSAPPAMTQMMAVVATARGPDGVFAHWVAWGLPADRRGIAAGALPEHPPLVQGTNDAGVRGWTGPCPAPGETTTVLFRVWAVDAAIDLPPETTREALYDAIHGRVLALGELTGHYPDAASGP